MATAPGTAADAAGRATAARTAFAPWARPEPAKAAGLSTGGVAVAAATSLAGLIPAASPRAATAAPSGACGPACVACSGRSRTWTGGRLWPLMPPRRAPRGAGVMPCRRCGPLQEVEERHRRGPAASDPPQPPWPARLPGCRRSRCSRRPPAATPAGRRPKGGAVPATSLANQPQSARPGPPYNKRLRPATGPARTVAGSGARHSIGSTKTGGRQGRIGLSMSQQHRVRLLSLRAGRAKLMLRRRPCQRKAMPSSRRRSAGSASPECARAHQSAAARSATGKERAAGCSGGCRLRWRHVRRGRSPRPSPSRALCGRRRDRLRRCAARPFGRGSIPAGDLPRRPAAGLRTDHHLWWFGRKRRSTPARPARPARRWAAIRCRSSCLATASSRPATRSAAFRPRRRAHQAPAAGHGRRVGRSAATGAAGIRV